MILERVMTYVDFFVPSVEELCFMLDRERFNEWKERAGDGDITEILDVEKDIKPLADQCMELGVQVLRRLILRRVTFRMKFFQEPEQEIPVSQHF